MNAPQQLRLLLRIARSRAIARRYFVTNGFDGALTMLGLNMGFLVSDSVALPTVIKACLGAAIALAISGLSSAYISEAAERKKELHELENAMVTDLSASAHGRAARLVPLLIAIVNGLGPLSICLVIIAPLWLGQMAVVMPLPPLPMAIAVAFTMIFLLGVFLGRVGGTFWVWSGLRALAIGLAVTLLVALTGI